MEQSSLYSAKTRAKNAFKNSLGRLGSNIREMKTFSFRCYKSELFGKVCSVPISKLNAWISRCIVQFASGVVWRIRRSWIYKRIRNPNNKHFTSVNTVLSDRSFSVFFYDVSKQTKHGPPCNVQRSQRFVIISQKIRELTNFSTTLKRYLRWQILRKKVEQ